MRKGTILLAEDEQCIRDVLCRILEWNGFTVLPAKDGAEAVEIAGTQADQIDLLVADIDMPKMTGVDLATRLERIRPKLPVLLMSGHPGWIGCLQPAWHFLEKPFRPNTMLETIAMALDSARVVNSR